MLTHFSGYDWRNQWCSVKSCSLNLGHVVKSTTWGMSRSNFDEFSMDTEAILDDARYYNVKPWCHSGEDYRVGVEINRLYFLQKVLA